MKSTSLAAVKLLQNSRFWLLGIAAGLVAIHLTLTWKTGNTDRLSTSILFWGAIAYLVRQKEDTLRLDSSVFSSFLGLLLIAIVLFRLSSGSGYGGPFLEISPFISALGLGLLASGTRNLKHYWRELIILFALAIPIEVLADLIEGLLHVSLLTAKVSTFMLWHLGFEVARQGVYIFLPQGAIEVYPGCSGLKSMLELLRLAVLFLVLFPATLGQKIWVPLLAVLLAFVVNGMRIALLAVLVSFSSQPAFEYWHKGAGSSIFSMISMLSFGLVCYFLLQHNEPEQDAMEC